jgi:hypothetical protein
MLAQPDRVAEVLDEKNHCHRNQNGHKMGQREVGKLDLVALPEEIFDKSFHMYLPENEE